MCRVNQANHRSSGFLSALSPLVGRVVVVQGAVTGGVLEYSQ